MALPVQLARAAAVRVGLDGLHQAVAHMNDAVGHAGDVGVVRDDGGGGTERAIDGVNGFEHADAGF